MSKFGMLVYVFEPSADMRLSSYESCDFTNAFMAGALLAKSQGELLSLSSKQQYEICWTTEDGTEPSGG